MDPASPARVPANTPDRRPIGVVIAAIVLALGALFDLASAALVVFAGALIRRGQLPATPGLPPPPAGFFMGVMAVSAFFFVALAVWGAATVVGLFRMRSWARISIMIIGGCVAAMALLNVASSAIMPTMMRSMPPQPNVTPQMLRLIFLMVGIVWLVVAAIGIWWLVYFALHSTRRAFALAKGSTEPPRPRIVKTTPPSTLADFSFAEPLPLPSDIPNPDAALGGPPLQAPGATDAPGWTAAITSDIPPPPPAQKTRPTSTTIIGVFLIVGAFMAVLESLISMPIFLFGAIVQGWPAHLTMLTWAVLTGYAGFGLIQLKRPAWWLTVAIFSVSFVNALLLLLPTYRARMLDYSLSISRFMSLGLPTPPQTNLPNPALQPEFLSFFLLIGLFFGVLFSAFLLVLLARARWAFKPRPPKPPAAL